MMDLHEENEHLKKLLNKTEQDVILAGKYGCELLASNTLLSEKLEEVTQNYSAQVKDLRQENYSLTQKLEVKTKTEHSQYSEIERLEKKLNHVTSDYQTLLKEDSDKAKITKTLNQKIEDLDRKLSEASLKIGHVTEELQLTKDHLMETKKRLSNVHNDHDQPQEIDRLHEQLDCIAGEKQNLESALNVAKKENDKMKFNLDQELKKRYAIEQELEEKEHQISSYINAVEKTRNEKLELQVEMNAMKFNEFDSNSKGNSLFAEVDDKRVKVKKQLISLQVSYDALKKKNDFNKHQITKMKHHMISLLEMSSSEVDLEWVSKLKTSLTQAHCEILELNNKLKKYECGNGVTFKCANENKGEGSLKTDSGQVCFELMRTKSKKEIEELKAELSSLRLAKIAETGSLLQCKQDLYVAEKNVTFYKAELLKLKLKMEVKCTPKEASKKPTLNEGKKEKIPGFQPEPDANKPDLGRGLKIPSSTETDGSQLKEAINTCPPKGMKRSVTFCEESQNEAENTSGKPKNEIKIPRHSSKGHVANVPPVHANDANMECKQQ